MAHLLILLTARIDILIDRLDIVLITTLMLGFFALQLDKTNITSAITTDFIHDIEITNNIVNSGDQLSLAAIVIFEIPSNMILSRLGAPLWLTIECLAWGLVAIFQAFITNQASFFATREPSKLGIWPDLRSSSVCFIPRRRLQ